MAVYLANTFSPLMIDECTAHAVEITLQEVPPVAQMESVVSHEVTAAVLSALLQEPVRFNRTNVTLYAGDELYCVIPNFRANVAREFTYEEVVSAKFRCFRVWCN